MEEPHRRLEERLREERPRRLDVQRRCDEAGRRRRHASGVVRRREDEAGARRRQRGLGLQRDGAGPDVPFGNRVQRSVDMVVGLLGMVKTGKTGDKSECLAYIKSVWTDMRPLSLRKKMSEASAQDSAA